MNTLSFQLKFLNMVVLTWLFLPPLFFCKKNQFKPAYDSNSYSEYNRKISKILNKADHSSDENEKARLYGLASELMAEKGDYKESVQVARKALAANPTQFKALASVGEYYLWQAKYQEAILYLNNCVSRNKKYARGFYLLGNANYKTNQMESAKQNYKKAIELEPIRAQAYNNLAVILMNEKNSKKALDILQTAIEKNADFALTYKNAGIAAEASKKKKDALLYYSKYLNLAPNAADAEVVRQWIIQLKEKRKL